MLNIPAALFTKYSMLLNKRQGTRKKIYEMWCKNEDRTMVWKQWAV